MSIWRHNTFKYILSRICITKDIASCRQVPYKAIAINGVSVEENISALNWGRLAAEDLDFVLKKSNIINYSTSKKIPFNKIIDNRYKDLINYQNKRYADKYKKIIDKVILIDKKLNKKNIKLSKLVANTLFKIWHIKDEFEVARLYTDGRFKKYINETFEGNFKLGISFASLLNFKDSKTKKPKKILFSKKVFILFVYLRD